MKKIGEYTAKGIILSDDLETYKIQLFDGRFDTGYRVTDFKIALSNRDDGATIAASAKLMTEPGVNNRYWNWSLNTEVAWAANAADANHPSAAANPGYGVTDPDNMIIEDLYIGAVVYNDQALDVCYMITLEKYDISDWQGALSMVRNKSQG